MRQLKFLLALWLAVVLASSPDLAAGSGKDAGAGVHVLRVNLIGLRNSNGKVHCTLFDQPEAFPEDDSKALKEADAPIEGTSATCKFVVPAGKYAIVAFHDENNNGEFDQDVLGLPEEGYAFSNNVKPTFSTPTFNECAFDYRGGDESITIAMIY